MRRGRKNYLQFALDSVCTSVDREGVSVEGDLSFSFSTIEPIGSGATGLNGPVSGTGYYDSVRLRLDSSDGRGQLNVKHTGVPDICEGQITLVCDTDDVFCTLGAKALASRANGIVAGGTSEDEIPEVDIGAGDGEVEHG